MSLVRTPYPFQTFGSGTGGGGGVNSVVAGTDITIGGPASDPIVNLSSTIAQRPTFNPAAPNSPFQIGANAFDQLVARLNADLLDGSSAAAFAAAVHTHAAGDVVSGQLALARGGSGADLSATGGSGHLVRQNSGGGTFTVGRFLLTDLDDDLVTFAKLQNIATARLLGRTTASAGDIEELTVGSGLSLTGGALDVAADLKKKQYAWVIISPAVGTVGQIRILCNCTVTRFHANTDVGTVTLNIEERGTLGSAGTDILSSDMVADATGEDVTSSFNNASLAAGNYLAVTISAVASSPTQVSISLEVSVP